MFCDCNYMYVFFSNNNDCDLKWGEKDFCKVCVFLEIRDIGLKLVYDFFA